MNRRTRLIEWPTLVLVAFCHGVWFSAGYWLWPVAPLTSLAIMAVAIALHSSLQHEILHGHPTANRYVNEALVFLPLGLFYPFRRFKATHLAHHRDERLTDPYDDPESKYVALASWLSLPGWFKSVMVFNNTLLGRFLIGPAIMNIGFWFGDLKVVWKNRRIRNAWILHAIGLIPVILIVEFVFRMPFWVYFVGPAYFGLSLISIRTYCEHQWAEDPSGRTIIVEKSILSILFLNNNLHIVHHKMPMVAWYELPKHYRARRAHWQALNGGYVFGSYFDIVRRHLLKPKEPVPHPAWRTDKNGA